MREAWEAGNAQQRRLAAAFKAARCLKDTKQEQLLQMHNDLSNRFANRESREDDIAEIQKQRQVLDAQGRTLHNKEGDLRALTLELQNRDDTDRIFGGAPPRPKSGMVGKKVGDTRCFQDRGRELLTRGPCHRSRSASFHGHMNYSRSLTPERSAALTSTSSLLVR